MPYKYKPPTFIDPPGSLRAQIVDEIKRWKNRQRTLAAAAMRAGADGELLEINNAKGAIYQANGWGASDVEVAK